MNPLMTDTDLGEALRAKADLWGYSPEALLNLAEEAAEWRHRATMPNCEPFPQVLQEDIIGPEHLERWPEWCANLISTGCKLDQLVWPDGAVTTRLLNPRGLILASFVELPAATK
jgi:hypothetical protein